MSIPNTHIRAVLDGYLERFPKEVDAAAPLARTVAGDDAPTSPQDAGVRHVSAGAVVLDPCWRVLMVRDDAGGPWLLPGGRLTEADGALHEAARSRLAETTGLTPAHVEEASDPLPLDLDLSLVPASPETGAPERRHFTFLYLYRATAATVPAGSGGFRDLAWRPHTDVPSARLAAKISQTLATAREATRV
ncbi:NUDIX domain-containing protein [Nocardiopsis sp. MG754419]|uniref:NUDIX domain-containing protein n=1 Tax=Nocardiopsis sp. MG754419 TaxID=2259865 RepID=UPI001BABAFB6|nr:NUDIX domain-containing protein [Nocardiopsis sp. MG754419]MBR8744002.1 NUDIX hydrolase [Nocardiopsis sp. MG754419]